MNIKASERNREFIKEQYEPLSPELQALRDTCRNHGIPLIRKDTEMVIRLLARIVKPKRILEIGTAIGYSAIFLAKICERTPVYTIEKDEDTFLKAKENIRSAGLEDRVTVLEGDGEKEIKVLKDRGVDDFDFIFIDASKSHYLRFLKAALNLAKNDAVILSDDIFQHGYTVSPFCDPKAKHATNRKRMLEYVDYIIEAEYLTTALLETGDGLAVSVFDKPCYDKIKAL